MSIQQPYLLTPGPLTTSESVKAAMMKDWGSWDQDFNTKTAEICQQLLRCANASEHHECVPMQGSGTFAVEAMLAQFAPRAGSGAALLIATNGT